MSSSSIKFPKSPEEIKYQRKFLNANDIQSKNGHLDYSDCQTVTTIYLKDGRVYKQYLDGTITGPDIEYVEHTHSAFLKTFYEILSDAGKIDPKWLSRFMPKLKSNGEQTSNSNRFNTSEKLENSLSDEQK